MSNVLSWLSLFDLSFSHQESNWLPVRFFDNESTTGELSFLRTHRSFENVILLNSIECEKLMTMILPQKFSLSAILREQKRRFANISDIAI